MQRYRTTLIMLGLLAVMAVAAFLLNGRNPATSTGVPTVEPAKYVYQENDPVIAIDVVSATGKVRVRQDITTTVWRITEPMQEDADPYALNSISNSLQKLAATDVLTGTSDLAQYGLDKEGLTVTSTFSNTQHTQRKLLIGNPSFGGSGYYVKLPESPTVYVVDNTTIEPLRSWLTAPPKVPPTPTPLPATVPPTATLTPTGTITSTVLPVSTPAPSPPVVPITGTTQITGTTSVTVISPGAANPSTPLEPTLAPASTPVAKP